jgi:lipoprotein-anchoring transpeptidase ErfK/SrfK
VNRGVTIAALSVCAAAGAMTAVLLAVAPSAGADDGTTTGSGTTTTPPTVTAPTITVPTITSPTTSTPLPPQPKLIAAGVTIGGTLVGGLTVAEAKEIVKARFARPLALVGGPGARIVLTPRDLGAASHLEQAVKLAARVKRSGFVVPLNVDVSRSKVDRIVTSLGKRFHRDPVDATLKLRNLQPFATTDVPGRRLKELVAAQEIVLALKTQRRGSLELPFDGIKAAVTSDDLGRAIVIRRGTNQLYLYQVATKAKLIRTFKVATGRSQYPTPLGRFEVVTKQLNPWWYPPTTSEWAKNLDPVPPGPGNPLGTRWMGLSAPYVGIHGTPDAASIGYSASHGCIRMLIPQVEWLFTQVDVGTPVFIVAA